MLLRSGPEYHAEDPDHASSQPDGRHAVNDQAYDDASEDGNDLIHDAPPIR